MLRLLSWKNLLDWGWLLILFAMFCYFWRDRRATLKTRSWVKTEARITHCEWTVQGHLLWPQIEYAYQVDERDLVGECLFHHHSHTNINSTYARQLAYRVTTAYKKNEPITIYYNPNQPEQAVIDTTVSRKLNFILFFLAILLVLQGVMVYKNNFPFFY